MRQASHQLQCLQPIRIMPTVQSGFRFDEWRKLCWSVICQLSVPAGRYLHSGCPGICSHSRICGLLWQQCGLDIKWNNITSSEWVFCMEPIQHRLAFGLQLFGSVCPWRLQELCYWFFFKKWKMCSLKNKLFNLLQKWIMRCLFFRLSPLGWRMPRK